MDVRLPDGSAVEACRDILVRYPTTRIIFLTTLADDESVLAAVLADVQGYVLKNIDSGLLIRSIHAVCKGQSILNQAVTQRALNWIQAWPAQTSQVPSQSLSPQEERVPALVAEGLTNKEIAATLRPSSLHVKTDSPPAPH
jgi:two-component system, NarL family, response regulator DevR